MSMHFRSRSRPRWPVLFVAGALLATVDAMAAGEAAQRARPPPLVAKLYSLYYKVDTLLDAYSLLPQRGSVYSEEGKRHRMKTTLFTHAKRQADYQVETRTVVKKTV